MSWVRTATSLITFGFTIYKFFQFEAGRDAHVGAGLLSPRQFAMIMIGIGLVSLLLGTIEHRQSMKMLRAEFGTSRLSVAAIVAALVSLMGLAALVGTLLRA